MGIIAIRIYHFLLLSSYSMLYRILSQIRNSKNVKAAVSDVIYLACYIRAISSLRLTAIGRIVSHFSGVKGLSPPGHCSGEPSATTQTVPFEISLNPCIYLCI